MAGEFLGRWRKSSPNSRVRLRIFRFDWLCDLIFVDATSTRGIKNIVLGWCLSGIS